MTDRTAHFARRRALLLLTIWLFSCASMADGPSIGRVQVSIWPEYDDPGVLAIYEGRFKDASSFPIKTAFLVPKGAIINDACSLSHDGQHFCQLYTVKETEEFDEIEVYLPYPNFYLSYHFSAFSTEQDDRSFSHQIKLNHRVELMEVDIQQPLRSSAFSISPGGGKLKMSDGSSHFQYEFTDIAAGENRSFDIAYTKQDREPSVDIKYSRMTGPKVFSSPYETQRDFRLFVYLMFGTGLAGIALISLLLWRSRRAGVA